ncbi:MAG: hypothetical protein LBD34_02000 [Puniceicoccales bacterium]|nr:hypothetical protein [Puniceicoccales bacterium]
MIGGGEFGIKCFNFLIEEGVLPKLKLNRLSEGVLLQLNLCQLPKNQFTEDEFTELTKTLLVSEPPKSNLLVRLIEQNGLFFNLNFLLEPHEQFETFVMALAGYGAFGGNLLTQLTLTSSHPFFSSIETSKAFVYKLLKGISSGRNFLITPIRQGKLPLPSLTLPEELEAYSAKFAHLHTTFENGIRRAFFGRTDGIGNEVWDSVRTRLTDMTLKETREILQMIANEVAVDCFDRDDNVDIEGLKAWMEFLGDAENFRAEPLCFIPNAEFMRSQMYTICECVATNKNNTRTLLKLATNIIPSPYGESLLTIMSRGKEILLSPAKAILASLVSLRRQLVLPTCTIDAFINEKIRNHPEQLVLLYMQILGANQFIFPSGYVVLPLPIVDGSITVDLENGGMARDSAFFESIKSGDPLNLTMK